MPRSLESLQKEFVAAVSREEPPQTFAATVRGGGRLSPRDAVEVYRRAFVARLSEALGETYERVWRVLGDEDFLAACRAYAYARPATSHDLSDHGADFPAFLEARPELAHAPFIADLARLEWAFRGVFHAPRVEPLAVGALAARAGAASRFVLVPSFALARLGHRVHGLWSRDLEDDSAVDPVLCEGEEAVVLWRTEEGVMSRVVAPPEAEALAALQAGRTLEEAASVPGADEAAVTALFTWVATSGLVAEVR